MEFAKIRKALAESKAQEVKQTAAEIKSIKATAEKDSSTWHIYTDKNKKEIFIKKCLTARQQQKPLNEQKTILLKKQLARIDKKYSEILNKLAECEAASAADILEISIDWHTGSVYGWQAQATIYTHTPDNWHRIESARTGGCGYDKASTATANGFNQAPELIRLICEKIEKKPLKFIRELLAGSSKVDAREFLGYGLSFYNLPRFDGGVGFESHQTILENLGFKRTASHSSKYNNFYTFARKTRSGGAKNGNK